MQDLCTAASPLWPSTSFRSRARYKDIHSTMSSLQASSGRMSPPGHAARLSSGQANFYSGQGVHSLQRVAPRISRRQLQVVNFKFLKQLGLKKPGFLPDFGKDKRLAVLNQFYSQLDKSTYDELLAESFKLSTAAPGHSTYGKADYTKLMIDMVKPAVPDFCWSHATSGDKSDEGYSIVTVQATGHHTGKALEFPGREAIQPSGKRFKLEEEKQKVKVEDGKIQEIVVLPNKGAGPLALYVALGGKA